MENQTLQFMEWEFIPARYIKAKRDGIINHNIELFAKHLQNAINAFKNGKNIILLGGVGRGKSFLAYEIAYSIKFANLKVGIQDCPITCYRASNIIADYKGNYSNLSTIEKILSYHSYKNQNWRIGVKGVIIDEIDDIAQNDYTLLNEIVVTCYERMLPLILISNKNARGFFENFSDKALSRLNENSMLIQAQGNDLRTLTNKQ